MDMNDFNYNSGKDTYYDPPRWDDFTLDDEKRARSRFSRFFLAISAYLIIATLIVALAVLVVNFAFPDKALTITDNIWFTWGTQIVAMYLIAFPIFFLIIKGMRSTVRVKSKMKFGEFLKLLCIAQALMVAGNLVGNIINSIISMFIPGDVTNSTEELIKGTPIYITIIVAVIIGPIVEELIFRKFLMDKLGIYGDRIAIVVSAVTFGIFHGNLYQLFYAVLLGFVLAYIYAKTSNIIYPILMHMLVNFLGSVVPMPIVNIMDRYTELSEEYMNAIVSENAEAALENFNSLYGDEFTRLSAMIGAYNILIYGLTIAGIVFLVKNRRKFFVSDRCEVLIPKKRRVSVILVNAGAIIFLVISVITIILNIIPTEA